MTNYVLLYTGGTIPDSEEEQAEVMEAWGAWYGKMGEAVVDGGNPFNDAKHITADGVGDGSFSSPGVTGYTVIAADSLDEAVEKSIDHPHVKFGGQVTIHQTFRMDPPSE